MWSRFDAVVVDRELGWARSIGFNSVRVYLSALVYSQQPRPFLSHLETFLQFCRQHELTAMLVLFDCCGIEPRSDAVRMTTREAYHRFVSHPALSASTQKLIEARYREFAEGRGKDLTLHIGKDTPFDVLFWQNWSPNPGLSRMTANHWPRLSEYVDAVLDVARKHPSFIACDILNEPGCLFDVPSVLTRQQADQLVGAFVNHFSEHIQARFPGVVRTIGSENLERMKALAAHQSILSIHCYKLGAELSDTLTQALAFVQEQKKPLLLTECLANTDNWLKTHGEERLSTDEAQLRHYQQTLPLILKRDLGWYSWGFVAGQMFTPFTDILYPNGYRRPAAVYLEEQLRLKP